MASCRRPQEVARNRKKYEKESLTSKNLIVHFISQLRLRVLADFLRMGSEKFKKFWCVNNIFAQIVEDKANVLLKPP